MGTRSGRRKEFGPSSSTGWTPSPPRSPEESRDQGNESGGEDGEIESISNIENHSGQEMRNETGMLNTTMQHAEDQRMTNALVRALRHAKTQGTLRIEGMLDTRQAKRR